MHVRIANPQWREKRSRHSRHVRNQQFYVSGKRPIAGATILYPAMLSDLCDSLEDRAPVDNEIYVCPIFLNKFEWLDLKIEHQDGGPSNGHQGDMLWVIIQSNYPSHSQRTYTP